MTEKDELHSRRTLFAVAVAIGVLFTVGERLLFSMALERPIDLGAPDALLMNATLVTIPFLFLAKRSSARALPWLLAIAATGWLHWWWLSQGIAYQKAPDHSGVDMFGALIMLLSPLPISGLAIAADNILRRLPKVR